MTRGRKLLIGCLVALGAGGLLAILGVTLVFRWLQTPGEPLAGNRLIDADTRVYVEMVFDETNPGARQLIRSLLQAQQQLQAQAGDLPPFLAWMRNVPQTSGAAISDRDIDKLLPLTAIITGQSRAVAPEGGMSFTVNLPSASNSFRLVDRFLAFGARRRDDMEYLVYRDEAYYRFAHDDGDLWMSIVDANLVFSRAEPSIRATIDRLSRPAGDLDGTSAELVALLTGAPPDHVIRFASRDHTAELLEVIAEGLPELATLLGQLIGDSKTVTGWLRVDAGDLLVGEFEAETGRSAARSSGPLRIGDTIRLEIAEGRIRLALEPIRARAPGWTAWRLSADGVVAGLVHRLQQPFGESAPR